MELIRNFLKRHGVPISTAGLAALITANTAQAIPPAVATTVGKVALAGTGGSGTTAAVMASKLAVFGGLTLMTKKVLIGVGTLLLVAGMIYWLADKANQEYVDADLASQMQPEGLSQVVTLPQPEEPGVEPAESPVSDRETSEIVIATSNVHDGGTEEAKVEAAVPIIVNGRITGRVYDNVSGEGIEGVTIGTDRLGEEHSRDDTLRQQTMTQVTDKDGAYELLVPTPATYTVFVHDPGYYVGRRSVPQKTVLSKGQHVDGVDFALHTEGRFPAQCSTQTVEGSQGQIICFCSTFQKATHTSQQAVKTAHTGSWSYVSETNT